MRAPVIALGLVLLGLAGPDQTPTLDPLSTNTPVLQPPPAAPTDANSEEQPQP